MENSKAFVSLLINEPVYIIDKILTETPIQQTEDSAIGSKVTNKSPIPNTKPIVFKKVIVHCNDKNTSDVSFLSKILLAVNISDHQAYITTNLEAEDQISSNKHIYFGIKANSMQNPKYEVIKSSESMLLYADALAEIQLDVTKKKLLWNALQKMFL